MAKSNTSDALKCMNCGAPIKSGFFCQKCQSGETDDAKPADGWKGSRFTGDAKKNRQRQMLMEDLRRWGKTLLILVIIAGVGYGGYAMFGDRVKAAMHGAESATQPKPKYDPTKDASTNEDDQAQSGNGKRAFSSSSGSTPVGRTPKSVDGGGD